MTHIRNLLSSRDPSMFFGRNVLHEILETRKTTRLADNPTMQPNRHHARHAFCAFLVNFGKARHQVSVSRMLE